MSLPVRDVAGILADNLRLRGSVLPLPARRATRWARDLGLPRGGETVLYTGMMYQLVPYIERLVALEQRLGGTPLARLSGLARRVNRLISLVPLAARPSRAERAEADRVPARVARLLRAAGVEFGYLYEDDLYAGALAHDLGADSAVAAHARRVAAIFARYGVREVITIDPHTTYMLRTVYPRLAGGFDVRVRSYLEVLAERGLPRPAPSEPAPQAGRVVIHDSCLYARAENVIQAPRDLLAAAGLTVGEPGNARERTWCCGGPAEALYPDKAAAVATARVAQLRAVAPDCVTMCPICLVNLRKAADGTLRVRDISEYLREGACC
jgi:Fe-S oxidoreductase